MLWEADSHQQRRKESGADAANITLCIWYNILTYQPPPKDLAGFPGAKPVKLKTPVQRRGGRCRRWKEADGYGRMAAAGDQHSRSQDLFKEPRDNPLYDGYPVEEAQAKLLQTYTDHPINLQMYD